MFEHIDEVKTKKNTKNTYSNTALLLTMCTLGIIAIIINYSDAASNKKVPLFLDNAADISSILGMIFTVISIIQKEPNKWQKWTAGIMNTVLFVILISSSFYAIFLR